MGRRKVGAFFLVSFLSCSFLSFASSGVSAAVRAALLWPTAGTNRKELGSFSSELRYIDEYPEVRIACSEDPQYAWIKERNPDLWRRLCAGVERGQFVPVGGSWIEPDCNLPSGESLVRQFLHGQRFAR